MLKYRYKKSIKFPLLTIIILVIISFSLLNFSTNIFAEGNKTPKAKITYSLTGTNLVNFDGSGSTDDDGTIVSYSWDFGDGSNGSDASAEHTYSAPGKYEVVLTVTDDGGAQDTVDKDVEVTVTDNGGAQDTADKDVEVKNKTPKAKITYSLTGTNLVNFDGSGSTDDDGTIVSYSWDFGDESKGSDASTKHTYKTPGKYKVVLTVTDNGGATGEALIKIEINDNKNNIENNISVLPNQEISNPKNLIKDNQKIQIKKVKDDPYNNSNKFIIKISKTEDNIKKYTEETNTALQNLLRIQKNTSFDVLDINVNFISDILDLNKMIENNKLIAVIDLNDIIDLNCEEDTNQIIESTTNKKDPQFLINFWEKIKTFSILYK